VRQPEGVWLCGLCLAAYKSRPPKETRGGLAEYAKLVSTASSTASEGAVAAKNL